jgi:hypothetical protein
MTLTATPSRRRRISLSDPSARDVAIWSLLMAAATPVVGLVVGAVGTFLQFVVFDLEEQQLLSDAGAWGYVSAVALFALMVIAPSAGLVLGVRARRLGERRLGAVGAVVNALVVSYLAVTAVAFLAG